MIEDKESLKKVHHFVEKFSFFFFNYPTCTMYLAAFKHSIKNLSFVQFKIFFSSFHKMDLG